MEENAFYNDLMKVIWDLRTTFIKHGMKPPISIEIGDVRDSQAFRYNMPRDLMLAQPRMGETPQDAEWVCEIMGVEVRMPAQWRTDMGGRKHLV